MAAHFTADRRLGLFLCSAGDGPEIRIDGLSLFGDVEVSDRPRG